MTRFDQISSKRLFLPGMYFRYLVEPPVTRAISKHCNSALTIARVSSFGHQSFRSGSPAGSGLGTATKRLFREIHSCDPIQSVSPVHSLTRCVPFIRRDIDGANALLRVQCW